LEFPHDCASWNMLMEYQCNHLHSISDCKPLLCAVLINQNCFDLISNVRGIFSNHWIIRIHL
jgi:hypothetical protein